MYKPMYLLPKALEFNGERHEIRSDYRAVLDICAALNDPELSDEEKAGVTLMILFPDFGKIIDADAALMAAFIFINHGEQEDTARRPPKLMDWEQDFKIISPGVDKVLGYSCRQCDYLHWWEFLGAYYEIGEGMFSTIVAIRSKLLKGKKLEPFEKELLANNPIMVRLKTRLTDEENEFLQGLGVI